jgi:tricorn protease interacting factor F2/3
MKTFEFLGSEVIKTSVKKPSSSITLNSKDLTITDCWVRGGSIDQRATVLYSEKYETATLRLKKPVSGDVSIHLVYSGKALDDLSGLYRSRYKHNGKDKYLLTTQFEAARARKAFPCFDQPDMKASFQVSLIIDKGLDAISNTSVESVSDRGGGKKEVRFSKTPRMSTYLVYMGAGNYDYVYGKAGSTPIRVITTPGNGKYGKLAMSFAKKFVPFYEEYFGIPFPMPKLDLIGIPDFAAGAMENWGAITFREAELIGDEKTLSEAQKQHIAEVVAHELTHHWFGDLVTMVWWDDIWLNESFATYMSYKAMDAVFPEWKIPVQYLKDTVSLALNADALKTTHPISTVVSSPAEIDSIFDSISYEKGGSLLMMIEDYVGPAAFRKGLSKYLKEHSYGNARKEDLWGALAKASSYGSRKDVARLAGYWINTPGYPIVDLKRENGSAYAVQRRFLLGSEGSGYPPWPIPLHYMEIGSKPGLKLLNAKKARLAAGKGAIKLNYGQHGLYRVRYCKADLQRLGSAIKGGKLGDTDAWGIENDLFVLARKGEINAAEYLEFVEDYCTGLGYPVNSNIISHTMWIYNMLYGTGKEAEARKFGLEYCGMMLKKLGYRTISGEPVMDSMIRGEAFAALGLLGDKKAIAIAEKMLKDSIAGRAVDPNLSVGAYRIVALNMGEKYSDKLEALYRKSSFDLSRKLLISLGMFKDKKLIRKYLDYSMTKNVRLQDAFIIPMMVSGTPSGKGELLAWTKRNWQRIKGMFEPGTHMLDRYVENFSSLSGRKNRDEIVSFFTRKENARADIARAVKQTAERIEANDAFMKKNA